MKIKFLIIIYGLGLQLLPGTIGSMCVMAGFAKRRDLTVFTERDKLLTVYVPPKSKKKENFFQLCFFKPSIEFQKCHLHLALED